MLALGSCAASMLAAKDASIASLSTPLAKHHDSAKLLSDAVVRPPKSELDRIWCEASSAVARS